MVVWNRTQKTKSLAVAGATVATTPQELSRSTASSTAYRRRGDRHDHQGQNGYLSGYVRGKLFIDMSTVRPGVEIALAAKVREKGAALIECPVGGTVGPAKEGKLFGFVGGDAGDVARAKPVLDQLCRRVEHVGPVGTGASIKLAINLPLLVYYQALGEALSLCPSTRPARLIDIFADTSGDRTCQVRARDAATLQGKERHR